MQTLGIIDIGSNSMHLLVVQIREDGSFKVIDELKENVRLGKQDDDEEKNRLSLLKMAYALDTLGFYLDLCKALKVTEIITVATEAVRRATNQNEFVSAVKGEYGLDIRILSGEKEAYYDYYGVVNSLDIPDGLVMDIGGGSTELALFRDKKLVQAVSLPFGTITLTQMFDLENTIDERKNEKLRRFLLEKFGELDWICGDWPLIGIGGSFRNLGKIDRRIINYPLDVTHNYLMSANSVQNIADTIMQLPLNEREKIKGLSKERADIFPSALAEITALIAATEIRQIIISGSGIREGLVYEQLLTDQGPIPDILDHSLRNTMCNYNVDQPHARHIWKISLQLYEQLYSELHIGPGLYKVLKTAALLHDCGINISFYNHHQHSFYEIINSRVNGLSQKELIMAALTTSMHRKDEVKIAAPFKALLTSQELLDVQKLGILLRIAENLDRRHNGNIYKIHCEVGTKHVTLYVSAKINPNFEIANALNSALSFKKVFNRQLFIEESVPVV